jgi:alanine racemase
VKLIAVVKADGYGHGAIPVARAALAAGAWGLAVSTLEEAAEVRDLAGAGERLLVMGGLVPADAGRAAELGCAVTCFSEPLVRALAAAASPARPLPVHLKVDTGMGRLGCTPQEAPGLARLIAGSPALRLAGVYTHFAVSESDPGFTHEQHRRFMTVFEGFGLDPGLRHANNSAAALRYPELALDAVRVGIALYGCEGEGLRPALALRGLVTHVKTVPVGATVGYGATWRAERESRVATVAMGYADGVHRARANRGEVLVRGGRAPLIGRVSMDAVTLDVTEVPGVAVGDTATFIGGDREQAISAAEAAAWAGTISYEVLTAIGRRVERRYWNSGLRPAG